MGTAGEHLEDPSESDPKVKTRHNIGQMIDSSAAAMLTLIKEEQPTLIAKHGIQTLERDSRAAANAEEYMWASAGFAAAVTEFFATVPAGAPAKNVDYDFWVHAAMPGFSASENRANRGRQPFAPTTVAARGLTITVTPCSLAHATQAGQTTRARRSCRQNSRDSWTSWGIEPGPLT